MQWHCSERPLFLHFHNTTRTGKRSPHDRVSGCPSISLASFREGAGRREWTAAQWAWGTLAEAHATAVCISASLCQHNLIKTSHWAAYVLNFPSLALLTTALKVERRWCPPSGFLDSLPAVPESWEGFLQKMNQQREDSLCPASWPPLLGRSTFMLSSWNAKQALTNTVNHRSTPHSSKTKGRKPWDCYLYWFWSVGRRKQTNKQRHFSMVK